VPSLMRTTLAAAAVLAVAACGGTDAAPASPSPEGGRQSSTPSGATTDDREVEDMTTRLTLTIGEERFGATLEASAAARDLLAQLPVTVEMTDHGGVEKTGPLPAPLSLDGQPEGADPDVGDLGYYSPGDDLVLYYGDQGYYPGIVVLGRLDDGVARRIGALDGSVTVTVEAGR
jgi:hypothetical protein